MKSLEPGGALMTGDFDSHLCPANQHVPAHPHLGEAALANGVQELIVASTGLLVTRDGCMVH